MASSCGDKGDCHKGHEGHEGHHHKHHEGGCGSSNPGDHKIVLHYFNARGRGECIRWLLHLAKVDFEDNRINMEDWPKHKADAPTGQMPYITCTDTKTGKSVSMAQTYTILRNIACRHHLAGKTPCEHGRVDEFAECFRDVAEASAHAFFEKDAERKEAMIKKLKEETGPRIFGYLEKAITENDGHHLVGECFTYADVLVACFVDNFKHLKTKEEMEAWGAKFPKLFAMSQAVAETPQIKEWLAKRPATPF